MAGGTHKHQVMNSDSVFLFVWLSFLGGLDYDSCMYVVDECSFDKSYMYFGTFIS